MRRFLPILLAMCLTGCAGFLKLDDRSAYSSSVVSYLYPKGQQPDINFDTVPVVELPARVGLAFVPSHRAPPGFSAADRELLLQQVRQSFANQDFISRIEIIPDQYLSAGGGFDNLEQVARLFGVDIVALVSFDQLVQSSETTRSLIYLTLVGAYTVQASRNEVVTFVDTAIIHLPSRSLLLRAPGQSRIGKRSTAVHAGRVQRGLSRAGFEDAMADMAENLDASLAQFNQRAREEGPVRLVQRHSGKSWHELEGGEGSIGIPGLLLLLLLTGWLLISGRRRPGAA